MKTFNVIIVINIYKVANKMFTTQATPFVHNFNIKTSKEYREITRDIKIFKTSSQMKWLSK